MISNSAVEQMPGNAIGARMSRISLHIPAPSTRAASRIAGGISQKYA